METKEEGLGVEMLDLLVDHFQGRRPAAKAPVERPRQHDLMRSFMATAFEAMGVLLVISLAERLRPETRHRPERVAAVSHLKHRFDEHHRQRS